jgi:hypothetical protein
VLITAIIDYIYILKVKSTGLSASKTLAKQSTKLAVAVYFLVSLQ